MPHLRDPETGYCQLCHRAEIHNIKCEKSHNQRIIESKKLFNAWRSREDQPQRQHQQQRYTYTNGMSSTYSTPNSNTNVRNGENRVRPYDDIDAQEIRQRNQQRARNQQKPTEKKSSCNIL
jgi:hypothetical protein